MDITVKCPNCGIGMDIHMMEQIPELFNKFITGYRDCPNCRYEIIVHISAMEKEKVFDYHENNKPF